MRDKTLEELDGEDWGKPSYPSYLVTTCYKLRKKRIGEFSVEDLRIMIGQNFGLPYLMPIALEVLNENPLADGDFYEGDLLGNVLKANKTELPKDMVGKIEEIAFKALPIVVGMDTTDEIRQELISAIKSVTEKRA